MTGATIDVQHPPAGWSHLQGPLLHVLVALGDDDERYAPALAAASGGDLDDVLEQAAALDAWTAGAYPFRPLAERANGHVFAPDAPTLEAAAAFWVEVKAARRALRRRVPWWRRLLADVSPKSAGSTRSAGPTPKPRTPRRTGLRAVSQRS